MTTVFVHIRQDDNWNNYKKELKFIPHKGDYISFGSDSPTYEVEKTLFNCFECEYEIEIFIHPATT